jgi:hypothetical protein
MTKIQDQISQQMYEIKAHANKCDLPEKNDPLRIVPFVSKRCIVACGPGRCNCWPTVGHHFCIIFESHLRECSNEFLTEMGSLQHYLDRGCQVVDSTDQLQVVDETHLALQLSGNSK